MIKFHHYFLVSVLPMMISCNTVDRTVIVKTETALSSNFGKLVTIRGLISFPKGARLSFEDNSGEVWLFFSSEERRELDGHMVVVTGRLGQIEPVKHVPGEISSQGFTGMAWKLEDVRIVSIIP